MFKKIAALLALVLLITSSLGMISFAEESSDNKVVYLDENGNEVMPCWEYVSTLSLIHI